MRTKIRKWGNSLGLRIPKAFAEEVGVAAGSEVDLSIESGDLVIRLRQPAVLRLEDLLAEVTPDNIHEEIELDGPVGREAW